MSCHSLGDQPWDYDEVSHLDTSDWVISSPDRVPGISHQNKGCGSYCSVRAGSICCWPSITEQLLRYWPYRNPDNEILKRESKNKKIIVLATCASSGRTHPTALKNFISLFLLHTQDLALHEVGATNRRHYVDFSAFLISKISIGELRIPLCTHFSSNHFWNTVCMFLLPCWKTIKQGFFKSCYCEQQLSWFPVFELFI